MTAVAYLLLTSSVYLFSNYVPYQQHIVSSVHRLSAHVVALVVIWMACWTTHRSISVEPGISDDVEGSGTTVAVR